MGKATVSVCVFVLGMCLIATVVTSRDGEPNTATKPPGETQSPIQPKAECFCTYDQDKSLVKAQLGHKLLKRGDKIMQGETVTFECKYFGRVLLWKNNFRFFGRATMTCSTCTRWQSDDLPTCNYTRRDDTVIGFEEDLKILAGGTVDMKKGESRRFFCSNSLGQPQWDYGDRQGVSVEKTRDDGRGNVMFVSYLDIVRAEDEHSGRYECSMQSEHNKSIGSAFLNLQVKGSCSVPDILNGEMGRIGIQAIQRRTYEEFVKVSPGEEINSNETLFCRCEDGFLPAEDSELSERNPVEVTCIDGTWSKQFQCRPSTCDGEPPEGTNSVPVVSSRNHGHIIWYRCTHRRLMKITGEVTCHFGSWIGVPARCVKKSEVCPRIPRSPGLEISYSDNQSVGSIATFSCSPTTKNLIGSNFAECKENGGWSNSLPHCEDPKCSVEDLLKSIDGNVQPDMTGVNEKFMPSGSAVSLRCSNNSIITGNSSALCGKYGKWELGRYECQPGCVLDIDPSSHLLVEPMKDIYRIGESILLTCPNGKEMSTELERLMCLAGSWSDSFPFCIEEEISLQP